ncbi:hypothetical protein GCM10023333_22720 [Ferrimonas pelagia]|uniref:Uncharacterized protein n=1 Tax=Ferrimonas pelagia TaxID=1177826 RepID=A0ABP9F396_9GAMM
MPRIAASPAALPFAVALTGALAEGVAPADTVNVAQLFTLWTPVASCRQKGRGKGHADARFGF